VRGIIQGGLLRTQNHGLAGLGLVNVVLCDTFEQAIEALGFALEQARAENKTALPEYQNAKAVYDTETGFLFGRSGVGKAVGNCESQTARIAGYLVTLNSKLTRPVVVPAGVQAQAADAQRAIDGMPAWQKMAIIGGISVVGVVGIAYITGQLAPLLRAFKR